MQAPFVADLHNHSTASDGELRPAEVVAQAAKRGLEAVALTDHDTLAGLDEAQAAGRRFGIEVIPGLELTLRFQEARCVGSLHLLLYFPVPLLDNTGFRAELAALSAGGRGPALVAARVAAINRCFGPAGREPLLKRELTSVEFERFGANITRRHFAKVLADSHGLSRDQITRIIANRSPAYLPSGIALADLVPFRRRHRFLLFLAHPAAGSYPPPSHYREVLPPWPAVEELLPRLLAPAGAALDGLEIEYPGHTEEHKVLLRRRARERGLLISGGSDGHNHERRPYGICGLKRNDFAVFRNAFEQLTAP